jgi:hypothetical protein
MGAQQDRRDHSGIPTPPDRFPEHPALLTGHQRAALRSCLGFARLSLRFAEALLAPSAWQWPGEMPPESTEETGVAARRARAVERLRDLLAQFQARCMELMEQLDVSDDDERDLRQVLLGQIQRARDALQDVQVEELSGYGALAPEAEALLRPRIAELIVLTNRMEQAVLAMPRWPV